MDNFFNRIQGLIAHDELDLAVEQLAAFLKGTALSEALREILVQAGRLTRLRVQERRGFVGREQVSRERARIADALLQLVDELSSQTTEAERPFPTSSVSLVAPVSSDLEKIIGANNLKSIGWVQKGLDAAKSVCRIVTPRGLGTGFLISRQWIMTNHHVLNEPETAAKSYAEFNFQEDALGRMQEYSRYRLLSEGFQADLDLDFSIVRIESGEYLPPLELWGTLVLARDRAPGVGEHVTIVQHPGGGPKQIALTANQVVNVFEHRLQYTTDTLPGSSGSPVFNDDWIVVALHHAGGNLVTNQRGDRMFANEGILLARILEKLAGHPDLPSLRK
jgi:V8-like Glu-specific endopeptidase